MLQEMAKHAFCYCSQVYLLWEYVGNLLACMKPENVLYLDISYVCDNVAPSMGGPELYDFPYTLGISQNGCVEHQTAHGSAWRYVVSPLT